MVRREFLLVPFALLVLILPILSVPAAVACTLAQRVGDSCAEAKGIINNGGVDLSAGFESNSGGSGTSSGDSGTGQGDQAGDGGPAVGGTGASQDPAIPDSMLIVRDPFTVNCTPGSPCDPNLVLTMSDIVNFKPIIPSQGMEPDGWMATGLPTNFFAEASVHTRSGPLLGFPAEVRFTPVRYRWDYGDGSTGSSATGGATWAEQNLPEFSITATSHTYRSSGTYVIALTVDYAAEYRFAAQPWRSIGGTLAVPANPISARAGTAKTVLVDRECTRNPSGPGC